MPRTDLKAIRQEFFSHHLFFMCSKSPKTRVKCQKSIVGHFWRSNSLHNGNTRTFGPYCYGDMDDRGKSNQDKLRSIEPPGRGGLAATAWVPMRSVLYPFCTQGLIIFGFFWLFSVELISFNSIKEGEMERDSEKSRKNWDVAQVIIHEYLAGNRSGGDKVLIAIQASKIHNAAKQAESHMETNRLVLAKLIYEKPKEMEEYIKKSTPHLLVEKK